VSLRGEPAEDNELDRTCADAMEELHTIMRRATALGLDLEAQIQDDLTPDFYAAGTEGLTYMVPGGELRYLYDHVGNNVPFKLTACKVIGDSWFVFHKDEEEPLEFFSQEAAQQASATSREK
jgi:hypothetical protein